MAADLREIVVALRDPEESERCFAVEDLQQVQDSSTIPYLIEALHDQSVRVREAAVDALVALGGTDAAEATASLLASEIVSVRNAAMEILENLGTPAVLALEKYINSSSADVRKFSIDTLGKLLSQTTAPSPRVIAALAERLSDENPNVAGAAAEALGPAGGDAAIPLLLEHLWGANQSSWLQCNIIVALSRISSQKAREACRQIEKAALSEEARNYLEMALNGETV